MGGQGDVLQVSEWGGGLVEASQWTSGTSSLVRWSTQENHTCRVPTWASGFGWPHRTGRCCFWVKVSIWLHLPFPQDFEHWLMTGLQTYTGVCLERGNKLGFNTGCSCSERMMFRHAAHFWNQSQFLSHFLLYLCLRLPANGTNIDHTGNRTRWFDLLWAQALIHFNILTVFWPHTWDAAFGFPWPAHSWTFPWLWHTPSGNTRETFHFHTPKYFILCGQQW